MDLYINDETISGTRIIAPSGRLDTNTAKFLEEHLADVVQAENCVLVIDMAAVDYVSSFGLRVLLITAKKIAASNGKLVLCSLHPDVQNVFRISGFLKILTVVDDRDAALAAI